MRNLKKVLSAILAATMIMGSALVVNAEPVRSELTNEMIDSSIQSQRPIAVMVDNEKTALTHYGVNSADIVYEMMNSTANGRITRLMCVVKDWQNLPQFGSIRSVRPTNFMVAAEYNAILVHDGGPFYINPYLAQPYTNNLSGGFARVPNGKRMEFTEYVTSGTYKNPSTGKSYAGLNERIRAKGYSTTYNEYYPGKHWNFSDTEISLAGVGGKAGTQVSLPFPHNSSRLAYNAATGTYDYYEYGGPHTDALTGGITTFKNVFLQCCSFSQYDPNGYMIYNVIGSGTGYYLTDGLAVPVNWTKSSETGITTFTYADGTPVTLNTGKTYVAIVPSDVWNQVGIQ